MESAVEGVANVAELLRRRAAERPDAAALTQVEGPAARTLSWRELDTRVDGVVAGLASTGLLAGQRIALLGTNTAAYVTGYLAALRAGLVVVPIDPGDGDGEIADRLRATGSRVLWAEDPERRIAEIPTLALTDTGLDELSDSGRQEATVLTGSTAPPADPEALAVLAATSGTSGPSKIVMLSHRALLAHLAAVSAYGMTDASTTLLAVVPFSHAFGLNTILGGWLACGGRLVLASGSSAELLQVIEREQVTVVPVTPRLLFELMSVGDYPARLGEVRTVLAAAAPLPWRLAEDFTAATGLRVERGYGLTEAGGGVAATLGHDILGPAHVGRALPGIEIMITTDPQAAAGEAVEPGPVLVRGGSLYSGYWPDGSGAPSEDDDWFDTGDLGYLAGEDLFLVDRARELVLVNGFTVYPTEVEQVLRELSGLRSVAALGVGSGPVADRLLVFVSGDVTVEQVADFCAARLAPFKRPSEIRIVDDLPRGVTGRVQRHVLRRWAADPDRAARPDDPGQA